jgi:serine/threonine protein kinase
MNQLELLKIMIQSACADGNLCEPELNHLKKKAKDANVSDEDLEFLIQTELKKSKNIISEQSGFIINNEDASGFVKENENISQSKNQEQIFTDITTLETQGAMSLIQKAKYLGSKWVVIKRIKPEYRNDKNYIALFEKEFENVFQLDHQHIVRVYGKSSDSEGIFYYMEYVDGRTISEMIKNKEFTNENLFKNIILQILDALIYVHKKQIYHRDLKPDNILVTFKGDNVKILDFGLANADAYIDNLQKVGTPKYSAPEQKVKSSDADHRSDIYSLGMIILEMLTSKTDKLAIPEIKDDIIKKLIQKCLQEKPENRYNSCEEIRNVLLAQKPKKIIPEWLEQKIVDFTSDGKITSNEEKVLELDAQNNNIDNTTLYAVIDLHKEKAKEKLKKQKEQQKNINVTSKKNTNVKQNNFSVNKFLRRLFVTILIIAVCYLTYEIYLRYQKSKEQKETKTYEMLDVKRTMFVNVSTLNLRKHANDNSEVLGNYPKGTAVVVTELGYYWARVEIDGKDGYMFLDYLSEKKP